MAYTYLSHKLNNSTPQYGGADDIEIRPNSSILNGDSANSTLLHFPNHVGTHIDLPHHFSDTGKNLDDFNADFWVFQHPFVLNYRAQKEEIINFETELTEIPADTDLLIINTGFQKFRGEKEYWNNNPGLAPELAKKLRTCCPELKAVGFDFISLTSYQNRMLGREAHKSFLVENEILIIEDMDLSSVPVNLKSVTALPLMVENIDGGPITILAEHD